MKKNVNKRMAALGIAAVVASTSLVPVAAKPYKPASTSYSTPSEWKGRHHLSDIYSMMDELGKVYKDYAKVSSLGKTTKGNDIKCITITDHSVKDKDKTGIGMVANIHGDERESGECGAYTAAWLLENADTPEVKEILQKHIIYVVPVLNPDSHEIYEINVRGTSQLIDKNGDGKPSNDLVQDITGDKYAGQLTGVDENRKKICDIGWEAKDTDGNGWLGDDSWASGNDINRNFDFQWAIDHDGSGGPSAASEKETQLIQKWLSKTPMDAMINLHTGIQCVLYPWGYRDTDQSNPEEVKDIDFMAETAEKMRKAIETTTQRNFYVMNSFSDYQTYSELIDYAYGVEGIHCYTVEVYNAGVGKNSQYNPDHKPSDDSVCKWNDAEYNPSSVNQYLTYDEFAEKLAAVGLSPENVKVKVNGEESTLAEVHPPVIRSNGAARCQRGWYVPEDQDMMVEGAKDAFLQMIYAEDAAK